MLSSDTMTNRNRLLFVSSIFPNSYFKSKGTYNLQQVNALKAVYDVDIIAPVSFLEKIKFNVPETEYIKSSIIYHPTFFYIPGIFRQFNGFFYYLSVFNCVRRLLKSGCYSLMFSTWLYPDSWAVSRLAQRYGLKHFIKVHGSDVNCLNPSSFSGKLALKAVAHSSTVFCVSKALRDKLESFGANPGKLKVLYNGIDKTCFRKIERSSASESIEYTHIDRRVLLFVGNIKGSKGVFDLFEAFSKICNQPDCIDVDLVYVGGGPDLAALKSQVQRSPFSSRVLFVPPQLPDKIALWMNVASLLCLPSHMEGVPNVILEALCCGLPVVATAVGGVPEIAEMDDRLVTVPLRDNEALAESLLRCLHSSASFGPKRAVFDSWETNAQRIVHSFENSI